MRRRYDAGASTPRFNSGQLAWLTNTARGKGQSWKLRNRYIGSYTVVRQVNDVNYGIQLTLRSKKNLVHADLIWKYSGTRNCPVQDHERNAGIRHQLEVAIREQCLLIPVLMHPPGTLLSILAPHIWTSMPPVTENRYGHDSVASEWQVSGVWDNRRPSNPRPSSPRRTSNRRRWRCLQPSTSTRHWLLTRTHWRVGRLATMHRRTGSSRQTQLYLHRVTIRRWTASTQRQHHQRLL